MSSTTPLTNDGSSSPAYLCRVPPRFSRSPPSNYNGTHDVCWCVEKLPSHPGRGSGSTSSPSLCHFALASAIPESMQYRPPERALCLPFHSLRVFHECPPSIADPWSPRKILLFFSDPCTLSPMPRNPDLWSFSPPFGLFPCQCAIPKRMPLPFLGLFSPTVPLSGAPQSGACHLVLHVPRKPSVLRFCSFSGSLPPFLPFSHGPRQSRGGSPPNFVPPPAASPSLTSALPLHISLLSSTESFLLRRPNVPLLEGFAHPLLCQRFFLPHFDEPPGVPLGQCFLSDTLYTPLYPVCPFAASISFFIHNLQCRLCPPDVVP